MLIRDNFLLYSISSLFLPLYYFWQINMLLSRPQKKVKRNEPSGLLTWRTCGHQRAVSTGKEEKPPSLGLGAGGFLQPGAEQQGCWTSAGLEWAAEGSAETRGHRRGIFTDFATSSLSKHPDPSVVVYADISFPEPASLSTFFKSVKGKVKCSSRFFRPLIVLS